MREVVIVAIFRAVGIPVSVTAASSIVSMVVIIIVVVPIPIAGIIIVVSTVLIASVGSALTPRSQIPTFKHTGDHIQQSPACYHVTTRLTKGTGYHHGFH